MTTWCSDCDNVHQQTREAEPWKRVCVKAPRRPGYGFVDPVYSPSPPYHRCVDVNPDGKCRMFEKRREPEKAA